MGEDGEVWKWMVGSGEGYWGLGGLLGSGDGYWGLGVGDNGVWGGMVGPCSEQHAEPAAVRAGLRKLEAFFGFLITIMALTFGYEVWGAAAGAPRALQPTPSPAAHPDPAAPLCPHYSC